MVIHLICFHNAIMFISVRIFFNFPDNYIVVSSDLRFDLVFIFLYTQIRSQDHDTNSGNTFGSGFFFHELWTC